MLERQCNAMQKAEAVRQLDHTCPAALGDGLFPPIASNDFSSSSLGDVCFEDNSQRVGGILPFLC